MLACSLFLAAPAAFATGIYSGFINSDKEGLKPFARDIGGLLGSGLNQTARPLGFSGFDIGVRAVVQTKPSRGNTSLNRTRPFGMGFIQAELGMPYRLDGFVRAGSYEGLTVAGAGLRYGLWNVSDAKNYINAMVVTMGSMAAHKYFYAVHFNAGLVCSVNVPVLSPFVGVGFDSTRLGAQSIADTTLNGKEVSVFEPRYVAGLRARIKLAYIAGGATYTHDRMLYNASLGVRF